MEGSTVTDKHESTAFKRIAQWAGPIACLLIGTLPSPDPAYPLISIMLGITAWMAIWWLTEAVHLAVTSFIPFLVLPATGIADIKLTAAQYMDPVLFLFMGGFLLAFAIEKWGLHQRLSLGILSVAGHTASSILLGTMCTAFFISMWISNTATVMMLLSAIMALTLQLKNHTQDDESHRKIASALLIGLAYAASIGGMSTLVGTPTNMIFYRVYNEQFGENHPVQFSSWMQSAFPVALALLLLTWLIIRLTVLKSNGRVPFDTSIFKKQLKELGAWSRDEKAVAIIFVLTALLWFTRADIELGYTRIKGWASLFPYPDQIQDSSVAVVAALLLFLLPSRTEPGRHLLEWKEASRLPYEIILLFGSGFALAKGFDTSGLSKWLAFLLQGLKDVPMVYIVLTICVVVTIISEFASNVASIQLVMPVLISLQQVTQADPRVLLIPAALAASLGFMLPVATAPNTIVYSAGRIKVREMAIAGLLTDLTGIVLITLAALWLF